MLEQVLEFLQSDLAATIGIIIATVITKLIEAKKMDKFSKLEGMKDEAYKLFLYAQKQNWAGPDKMKWVAAQIHDALPDAVEKIIPQATVEDWLQDLYNDFIIKAEVFLTNKEEPQDEMPI